MYECNSLVCELLSIIISSLAIILSGVATKMAHGSKKKPVKRRKKDAL